MQRIVCFHSDVDFEMTTHLRVLGIHRLPPVLGAALGRGALPRLQVLQLGANDLGSAGLIALAPALRARPRLKKLALNGVVKKLGPRRVLAELHEALGTSTDLPKRKARCPPLIHKHELDELRSAGTITGSAGERLEAWYRARRERADAQVSLHSGASIQDEQMVEGLLRLMDAEREGLREALAERHLAELSDE